MISNPFSSGFSIPKPLKASDLLSRNRNRFRKKKRQNVINRNRLLLVEDDRELTDIINHIRFERKWPLQIVMSSSEAISQLSLHPFDAVVLDWNLPDFSGDRLVKLADTLFDDYSTEDGACLKQKTPIFTFSSENKETTRFESSKYFYRADHWRKPMTVEELSKRLELLTYGKLEPQSIGN